jgi:hypothetical protein
MWFLQEDSMNEQEIKEQLCDVCHKMWLPMTEMFP